MAQQQRRVSFSGHVTAVVRQGCQLSSMRPSSGQAWSPAVNVYQLPGRLEVCVELAGVSSEGIDVRVEPGLLRVRGVRRAPDPRPEAAKAGPMRILDMEIDAGPFLREVRLPAEVDLERVESRYEQGMLRVVLPLKR
ncbi:MAG: Hsp20/alpha crystallin family protein [Phycisphaeraceae bacterium]